MRKTSSLFIEAIPKASWATIHLSPMRLTIQGSRQPEFSAVSGSEARLLLGQENQALIIPKQTDEFSIEILDDNGEWTKASYLAREISIEAAYLNLTRWLYTHCPLAQPIEDLYDFRERGLRDIEQVTDNLLKIYYSHLSRPTRHLGLKRLGRKSIGTATRSLVQKCKSIGKYLARKGVLQACGRGDSIHIIVPTYGHINATLTCLASVLMDIFLDRASLKGACVQIHVVDDCSPHQEGHQELAELCRAGIIQLSVSEHNLGFLESCTNVVNPLISDAYVILLSNNTQVLPGWLQGLYETFAQEPNAGLVGSKLIYPNGQLQEAGGIIWRDGSAWQYGNRCSPSDPEYAYLRSVDYISGASIMFRKQTWDQVGGFDRRYKIAYYEDTDFAFAIRQAGLQVLFQPTSQVIHHGGLSCGKDTKEDHRQYQCINQMRFHAKWEDLLSTHQENGIDAKSQIHRGSLGSVLIIESRLLDPERDAGSLFMMNYCLALRTLGYTIDFVPTNDHFLYIQDLAEIMGARGIDTLAFPRITSIKDIFTKLNRNYSVILLARPENANLIPLLRNMCPHTPLIYFTHDLHHLRLGRTAGNAESARMHKILTQQAEAMKRVEAKIFSSVDLVLHVSEEEEVVAQQLTPHPSLVMRPAVQARTDAQMSTNHTQGIIFVANFKHTPNKSGLRWFLTETWPLVSEKHPHALLHVVGRNPPGFIGELNDANIRVHGFVEDLAEIMVLSTVGIAPLREGAGVKGKILTCLSHGLPVVATSIGLEGIVTAGSRSKSLIEANSAVDTANSICDVLDLDAKAYSHLSAEAMSFVNENFGSRNLLRAMTSMLNRLSLPCREVSESFPLYTPRSTDIRFTSANSFITYSNPIAQELL